MAYPLTFQAPRPYPGLTSWPPSPYAAYPSYPAGGQWPTPAQTGAYPNLYRQPSYDTYGMPSHKTAAPPEEADGPQIPSNKAQKPTHPKATGNEAYAESAADTLYTLLRSNPGVSRALQDTLGLTPDIMEEIQSTAHDPLVMRKRLFQILADNPSGQKLQKALQSKWKTKLIKMAVQQATPDDYDPKVESWLNEFKKVKPRPRQTVFEDDPFANLDLNSLYA